MQQRPPAAARAAACASGSRCRCSRSVTSSVPISTAASPASSTRDAAIPASHRPTTVPIAPTRISSSDSGSGCHGACGRSPTRRACPEHAARRSRGPLQARGAAPLARRLRRASAALGLGAAAVAAPEPAAAAAPGRWAPLARAPAPALVALRHGVSSLAGVRCAASTSIASAYAGARCPRRRPRPSRPGAASPTARCRVRFPVGEYAAALRAKLRSFARVQLVGELVNLRPARARVYFELRDADRRDPLRGLAQGLGGDARARRRGARRGHAGRGGRRLRLLPRQRDLLARASPSRSPTCASPARATCWPASSGCASSSTPRGCSSARSGSPGRCCRARSA